MVTTGAAVMDKIFTWPGRSSGHVEGRSHASFRAAYGQVGRSFTNASCAWATRRMSGCDPRQGSTVPSAINSRGHLQAHERCPGAESSPSPGFAISTIQWFSVYPRGALNMGTFILTEWLANLQQEETA